jgi:hypothetical protein
MDQQIAQFIQARDHVLGTVAQKIEVYLTRMWNPLVKYTLIKETIDIIQNELIELFPDLPCEYLPRCRFRIFEKDMHIEAGIQNYYNHEPKLTFLGTTTIESETIDCYFRSSYDPGFNYVFIARYGHERDNYYYGSKTAEAEYFLGQQTPLSVAYGLAVEDGFIS